MAPATDMLLNAASQLPLDQLDAFVERVVELRAKAVAPSLSSNETALLMRISARPTDAESSRYTELAAKRDAESLTTEEHQELISLGDQIEALDVDRVEALVELARLRQTTLADVMQQLGIPRPTMDSGKASVELRAEVEERARAVRVLPLPGQVFIAILLRRAYRSAFTGWNDGTLQPRVVLPELQQPQIQQGGRRRSGIQADRPSLSSASRCLVAAFCLER
jgi:hypothetical protein